MIENIPTETRKTKPRRLRKRREFLRAAKSGLSRGARAFKLQAAAREGEDAEAPRFGFTVTKKVAGAVGRNRIRRRLREALRLCGASGLPGYDYVFVARPEALTAPFLELTAQIADGLTKLRPGDKTRRHHRNSKDRPQAS
ncbi:ribonuclease P protein component [Methylosinus sporium]|uniref:Ribonuclease P protein component n=1 Tax=Methylosinus sporium TaxID=428 RepID=A0A549SZZ9_METSR|nr:MULTISPECIES: ribonuclease P protein component [Methylosinus]MBU3888144.1 ribonuclease P protein component [Methylosinus sp. KRF6]TRL35201.1 ribonuclease P protein component [Methylosinus sporium]